MTAPPGGTDWLILDHAFMMLPAAASLNALRRIERPSAAERCSADSRFTAKLHSVPAESSIKE
ncbi:MAG: hypothetical protein WBX25_29420 [Rhodomicrobium sp.]